MKILWFIELEYEYGMRHGANLRFFNLSRELIATGHEVYFATNRKATDDPARKRRYLDQLMAEKLISGHFETFYAPPTLPRRLYHKALYPGLVNRLLRSFQEPVRLSVEEFLGEHEIDLCLFSNRALLFLVPPIRRTHPALVDWIDSSVLFYVRELAFHVRRGKLAGTLYPLRRLLEACLEERYYGRRCHANLTVSVADKRCLDLVNRRPRHNHVLLNGVALPSTRPEIAPTKGRLIFSGNMGFPPNHEGAIWFIDNVFPLLLEKRPDIELVIAGAEPPRELLARRSRNVHVTGFVEDLETEIRKSELCVAPLVSGSGFKNKIVEAIAADRFVVATSRAVEFLDTDFRSLLLAADTPRGLADHVLSYLEDPRRYQPALAALRRRVRDEFTWANRAEELLSTARTYAGLGAPEAILTRNELVRARD